MHCIENLLLILAARVQEGDITGRELAICLTTLAGASHWYIPEQGEEEPGLVKMNDNWNKWYKHFMISK